MVTAMFNVIQNDDLLSLIFIDWIDPKACLALLLVNNRFNALYRLRVPGQVTSSVRLHCFRVEQVRWALVMDMPERSCYRACALNGCLGILIWLFDQVSIRQVVGAEDLCSAAARGGHLHVLQWLRSRDPPHAWGKLTCAAAAQGGHLEVLQWLRYQSRCPWSVNSCSAAARGGHLEVLKWMRSQKHRCRWDANTCSSAAAVGNLTVLQWLRNQNPPCPWNSHAVCYAAAGGHVETLLWLLNQNPPCPISNSAYVHAARGGHLSVLKLLYTWNKHGQAFILDSHALSSGLAEAACHGHYEELQWLRTHTSPPVDMRLIRFNMKKHLALALNVQVSQLPTGPGSQFWHLLQLVIA